MEEIQPFFGLSTYPTNEFWEVSNAVHSKSYKTHPT